MRRMTKGRAKGLAGALVVMFGLASAGSAWAESAAPAPARDGVDGWSLGLEEDGVVVHTRPVPGSGIEEFEGQTIIAAPAEAILSLIRDSDRFHTWFPNCPESKLLGREGNVSMQYSVMDAPWPVSDRDNVFRSVTTRDPATGATRIDVAAAPDAHPEQPGRVRVRIARGLWSIEPLGADRARVRFRMHLDPGGGVPEWLINARVVATPFEALTNLRAAVGAPASDTASGDGGDAA